ncbi:MAG TPA: hypothetical protein VKB26_07045 [Candidatus Acidoferrales bacterium]|nr:hypothetical protein [Candidatus Acidoferrales bacterium]
MGISDEVRSAARTEFVFGNAAPARKLAVCTGGVSLSGPERAEILAVLAMDEIEGVAQGAAVALAKVTPENFATALAQADAAPAMMHYCAANLASAPGIADALAQNASCPVKALEKVTSHLSTASIQTLLENLERLTSSVVLINALAASPNANAEQRSFLAEMQKGAPESAELQEAVAAAEPDPTKRKTLLERLATMNVLQRVKLALTGGREERIILIRDSNKVVQRSVLQSPRLTDAEVESFASMTTLTTEILRLMANNRQWMKNYAIVKNLIFNSKTPLDITMHQLARLTPRDLKILSTSKSVPETLRSTAAKMIVKRSEKPE